MTQIHSVLGLTDPERPLITRRPFRSPHHSISAVGMSGGGAAPAPERSPWPQQRCLIPQSIGGYYLTNAIYSRKKAVTVAFMREFSTF